MATATLYNLKGETAGDITLDDAIFGVAIKSEVVSAVVEAQRANAHHPYADTKGRADRRGGGKKPWRQKGTGRARHGSSRSPIWRGGGVTFGPTKERNMAKKINKKHKRAALSMVLSDKVGETTLFVVDSYDGMAGKTKEMVGLMDVLPIERQSVLVVSAETNIPVRRSAQNMKGVKTILADSLNVIDLLAHKYVVVDKAGIEKIVAHFK